MNFDNKLHTLSEYKDRDDVLGYAMKEGFIDIEEMTEDEQWDYYYDSLANDGDYWEAQQEDMEGNYVTGN